MQRGDIRTLVRKRLGETTASFWTDAQLNTWINDGTRDLSFRTKCLRTNAYFTLTADVGEYTRSTIHSSIYSILDVYHLTGGTNWIKLIPTNRTDLDATQDGWRSADSSVPWKYYESREEDLFGIYPKPDSTNAGSNYVRVYLTYKPTDITTESSGDTTEPTIPEPLHLAIIEYVVATGFDSRGWGDRANDVWQKYYSKIQDYTVERGREREDEDIIMRNYRNL